MTLTDLNPDAVQDINELVESIVHVMITGAETCIASSTGSTGRVPVPWCTPDCRSSLKERIRAERALKRRHRVENKIAYNRTKAKCRYTFNIAWRASWQKFVSSITVNKS